MTTMKNNDLLIGAALIIGALYYSKQAKAGFIGAPNAGLPGYQGNGSMPGSAGSGKAQVLGGIAGATAKWLLDKATSSPITSGGDYYNYLKDPNYIGNQAIQEKAWGNDLGLPDGGTDEWTVG
ncbi:hypothetical protein [Undibacterium sp. Ren11W]|uniref:hypothetical protein n=1 Tax=Undibacterium sp. Ren11W TaxID=3413045 RepID=UPI003BF07B11